MIQQVFGLDSLSAQTQKELTSLVTASAQTGVLVGALKSLEDIKLAPLLLDGGVTYVLRFCSSQTHEAWNLKKTAQEFMSLRPLGALKAFGQNQEGFWLKRKFYPELALDALKKIKLQGVKDWLALWAELLIFVDKMHTRQLFHGHIAYSNLALEQDAQGVYRLELLDYGCLLNDRNRMQALILQRPRSGLAPELRPENLAAAPAADIFGLGGLLKESLALFDKGPQTLDPNISGIIESCNSLDAQRRPKLSDLLAQFAPRQLDLGKIGPRLLKGESTELQSGKILGGFPAAARSENVIKEIARDPEPAVLRTRSIMTFKDWQAGILLVCTLALIYLLVKPWYFDVQREAFDAEAYWTSAQPSLMAKVAEEALSSPESAAREIIVSDALKGSERPKAKLNLIRLAYNPIWEADLGELDRRVTLNLALASLLEDQALELHDISMVHPGVLFAIAASVGLQTHFKELEAVTVSKLKPLPDPFGAAFELLSQQKDLSLADPASIALAHLLAMDVSQENVTAFFEDIQDSSELTRRLRAMQMSLENQPEKLNQAYAFLAQANPLLKKALAWFEAAPKAGWGKVSSQIKISILLGQVSDQLALEQYADLLKFPWPEIVKLTARQLELKLGLANKSFVALLAQGSNKLSRDQNLALIFALNAKGELNDALISAWFQSKPDASTVLRLLLGRADSLESDTFNLEAARYISAQGQISPSLEDLRALSSHPEQMARAYAVSRLDPEREAGRKILEDMATLEPSKLLREQIAERLKAAAGKKKGP